MAFTYNLATAAGRVRLLIGDRNASSYIFEDDEITEFLSIWSSDVALAAAQALRSIAADSARQAIYYQIAGLSGFTMDRRDVAKNVMALADAIEKRALASPWEIESVLDIEIGADGVDRSNYPDTEA